MLATRREAVSARATYRAGFTCVNLDGTKKSEGPDVQRQTEERERLSAALEQLGQSVRAKNADDSPPRQTILRAPPPGDRQADFFVPSLCDFGTRDSRNVMDVAVFRLSKRHKRAGEVIRHHLADGYIEVKAGPDGMASVWDYDIVLMMISALTDAMNRYRDGKGEMPGRSFRPCVSEILKFCRKGDGSRQAEEVEAALDRLKGTTIKIQRSKRTSEQGADLLVASDSLIGRYQILSRTDSGKICGIQIEVPGWIYERVTQGRRPAVLALHPDYFLIQSGIGRFLYRLARQAAGHGSAQWAFRTLYERSGSSGSFKRFCQSLRELVAVNDLPEYTLAEIIGRNGPQLVMRARKENVPVKGRG